MITINSILESIKNNLSLNSNEKITNLSHETQLEIFRNYSEEIKPSIFNNTDIGNIINAQVDILSFYLPDFLVTSVTPTNNISNIHKDLNLSTTPEFWNIVFNNKIKDTLISNINDKFTITETKRIFGINVEQYYDNIFFRDDDYYYLSSLKISWDFNGVDAFDVYYKIGNVVTQLKTNIKCNWCIFTIDQPIIDLLVTNDNQIRFIIKSVSEPTLVSCESKICNVETLIMTDTETSVEKSTIYGSDFDISYNADQRKIKIINKKINITNILSKQEWSVKIKKELLDQNDVNINENIDYLSKWNSLDSFKITYNSIIDNNCIIDPNLINIIFNRNIQRGQILSSLLVLEGSEDNVSFTPIESIYILSENNINMSLTNIENSEYQYYRLTIGQILDEYDYVLVDSGKVLSFENNHSVVYVNNTISIDNDSKIIIAERPQPALYMFLGDFLTPPNPDTNGNLMFLGDLQ